MRDVILETEHLTKIFSSERGGFTAVHDVSFEIGKGEALGIVGESGSGKTTVARLVTGLLRPTEGKIREAYRHIQMIFQTPAESFNPRYTLGSGIGESLRNAGTGRKKTEEKVKELLRKCGLTPDFAGKYPHQVSGGECQRAAVARALAIDPKLLVCDEPTSALDVTVQKQILDLLLELKKKEKRSFLFICHDLALVQATPEEIICNPREDYTRRLVDSAL